MTEDLTRKTDPFRRVTVLGAGAWGTALAAVARQAGCDVTLCGRNENVLDGINGSRMTPFLPGVTLPDGIRTTTDLGTACESAEVLLIVTPSKVLRSVTRELKPHLPNGIPIVLCAKGIEAGSGLLLNEVAAEELPGHPIGALSGPTFAVETASGHPTAATIAFPFSYKDRLAPAESPAARLALTFSTGSFRPYVSDDIIGVEVAGAMKNVIAIACGIATGAGFAENTRAALITRGMEEMKSLVQALGGHRETVSGLSGAGDLMLTCSSTTSRNMSLGVQLGNGTPRAACFEGRPVVVEGEVNAISVTQLAARIGVSLPICSAVHAVLHQGAGFEEALGNLWARPLRAEPQSMDLALSHDGRPGQLSGSDDLN